MREMWAQEGTGVVDCLLNEDAIGNGAGMALKLECFNDDGICTGVLFALGSVYDHVGVAGVIGGVDGEDAAIDGKGTGQGPELAYNSAGMGGEE